MAIHFYTPQPPLSTYVDRMWLYDGYISPYAQERALPTGTATLVISFGKQTAHLAGTHAQPIPIETTRLTSHLGIHFRPGGAFPFLPLPVGELHNQIVGLDELWGSKVDALFDQLQAAPTPQAKFQLMMQSLLAQWQRDKALHLAVSPALQQIQQDPTLRIEEIAGRLGLTTRRLHQIFHSAVGVSPKLYQRLHRFQQVLHQLHTHPTVDWADLAVERGYFDQAHLLHDFQAFAQLTPTAYLAQPSREPNHVALTVQKISDFYNTTCVSLARMNE
jgi:AraC-like DNA-binding protein